jgi:hypothetical protein
VKVQWHRFLHLLNKDAPFVKMHLCRGFLLAKKLSPLSMLQLVQKCCTALVGMVQGVSARPFGLAGHMHAEALQQERNSTGFFERFELCALDGRKNVVTHAKVRNE